MMQIIKDELTEVKNKFGDERKTEITTSDYDIDIEDLIPIEDDVITMTHFGYIKRQAVDTYKSQRRGGRGVSGLSTREEDFAETLLAASSHDYLMFFTNKARMHKIKAYKIPEAGRQAKGMAMVNLLQLEQDEKVTAAIPVKAFEEDKYLIMLTKNGVIKKTELIRYNTKIKGGLIAIKLDDGDELIEVRLTDGKQQLVIGTHHGMSIRFKESDVRVVGRDARGVKAITLKKNDYIVGMEVVQQEGCLLTVSENGFGKRTPISEYKVQSRGGMGVKNHAITEKTGNIIGIKMVNGQDDLIMITAEGVVIRIHVDEIRICGRASQGVKLIRANEDNRVASIAKVDREEESEEQEETSVEASQEPETIEE